MVGSGDRAKCGFRPSFVGPDLERKKCAEKLSSSVPADARTNFDEPRTVGQTVILDDFDLLMPAAYPDSASQRTGFDTLRRRVAAELDTLIAVSGIDVPSVELAWNIRV